MIVDDSHSTCMKDMDKLSQQQPTSDNPEATQPSLSHIPTEMLPLLAEIGSEQTAVEKMITMETMSGDVVPRSNNEQGQAESNNGGKVLSTEPSVAEQIPITPRKKLAGVSKKKLSSNKKSRKRKKRMEINLRNLKHFVFIGNELNRWDQYRKELGIKEDEVFARTLLDGFRKYTKIVQMVVGPTFGLSSMQGEDRLHNPVKEEVDNLNERDDVPDFVKAVAEGTISDEDESNDAKSATAVSNGQEVKDAETDYSPDDHNG